MNHNKKGMSNTNQYREREQWTTPESVGGSATTLFPDITGLFLLGGEETLEFTSRLIG